MSSKSNVQIKKHSASQVRKIFQLKDYQSNGEGQSFNGKIFKIIEADSGIMRPSAHSVMGMGKHVSIAHKSARRGLTNNSALGFSVDRTPPAGKSLIFAAA